MSPFKPKYNLAIVGAGRQRMSILAALVPPRKEDESLRVIGVTDLNPEAPGILYAYRHNLFVTVNFTDLLQLLAGLGLSVVYGIVRDYKGIIKVDSVLGEGTTFTIRLPALEAGEEHGTT